MDYMDKLGQYYTLRALPMGIWEQLSDPEKEALESAMSSLRKDIEEPPLNLKKRSVLQQGYKYKPIISVQFDCPCCHRIIACQTNVNRCIECGQLLDWSDIDWHDIPCEDWYDFGRI